MKNEASKAVNSFATALSSRRVMRRRQLRRGEGEVIEQWATESSENAKCSRDEVEVQMFQLYRDGLEDLLADPKKKKADPKPLKIVLAEHSPTGLVQVEGAESMVATSPADVIEITRGIDHPCPLVLGWPNFSSMQRRTYG